MNKTLTCSVAMLVVSVTAVCAQAKPNFIVIFVDDLGYGHIGCFGASKIKTPNIDRMAREGLRFTNFYAQTVCGPSRAALMTYIERARNDIGDFDRIGRNARFFDKEPRRPDITRHETKPTGVAN